MNRPILALVVVLVACVEPAPPDGPGPDPTPTPEVTPDPTPTPNPEGSFEVSDPVVATDPVSGFDRLVDETSARGLDIQLEFSPGVGECPEINGNVVAADLDADGDPDLMFHRRQGFPRVFENQGGSFTERAVDRDVLGRFGRPAMSWAAIDLNGDALPDVTVSGPNMALVSWNQGDWDFSEFEVLYDDPSYPRGCMNTQVWGTLDGDADLDLVLPSTFRALNEGDNFDYWDEEPPVEFMEVTNNRPVVLMNEGLPFQAVDNLVFEGDRGTVCIAGMTTDRDLDGDMDLLLTSHRPIPPLPLGTLFRNDGLDGEGVPMLVDDGADTGVQFAANGMGVDAADVNFDGVQDYCFSDAGLALVCMVSDGTDSWFEGALAAGLIVDPTRHPEYDGGDWTGISGWSVEMVDVDNDGEVDVAQASGGSPEHTTMPDAIWRGLGSATYEERSTESGFGSLGNHYGLVSADFDGDGYRDLVTAGWTGSPIFWSNPPGPSAWVEVRLEGPPSNRQGFGARVEVTSAGRTHTRELHALRGLSQSEATVHFGLGAADRIERLRVHWPGGAVTEVEDLPVRVRVTAGHPEAP